MEWDSGADVQPFSCLWRQSSLLRLPTQTKRIRMQECCGHLKPDLFVWLLARHFRQQARLGSNIPLFLPHDSSFHRRLVKSLVCSLKTQAIQQATASHTDAPGYSPSRVKLEFIHIEKLVELRSQGPVQESGKPMSLHLRVEFLGCVSSCHPPEFSGPSHTGVQVTHCPGTCRSSISQSTWGPAEAALEFWAPQLSPEQGHTGCAASGKRAHTWGCSTQVQAAVPWPLYTLGIFWDLVSHRPASLRAWFPCHSAPSLTQGPYLEGRAGAWDVAIRASSSYKDAHM